MAAKEEIKKTVVSEPIKIILQSLLPLAGTLILAAIPQVRDAILNGMPKWLLLALAVTLLSTNLLLFLLLLKSRREIKELQKSSDNLQSELNKQPLPKRTKFGVLWDKDLEPYCPVHSDVPLNNWMQLPSGLTGYMCPVNTHLISLKDGDGNLLTPKQAKAMLENGQ